MRIAIVLGFLLFTVLAAVGQPAAAHNPDCMATSHTLIDIHYDCKAREYRAHHWEWCVLSVDYQTTHGQFLCDAGPYNGNPFH